MPITRKFKMGMKLIMLTVTSTILAACTYTPLIPLEEAQQVKPDRVITVKINNYCPTENHFYVDFYARQFSYGYENYACNIEGAFDRLSKIGTIYKERITKL